MQHIEFFHREHFINYYHRVYATGNLSRFIDYFWETKFDQLWRKYPNGFSDALFPNIGYSFLINLGTPFIMQLEDRNYEMKTDGFLPRHTCLECYHQPGNRIFGIKFKISPVILEKKINFGDYRDYIFPLSYLLDNKIIAGMKSADSFDKRVEIICRHYQPMIQDNEGILPAVSIVTELLKDCYQHNRFSDMEALAAERNISARTLHRYFEMTTSLSSKKALQILRIRKATEHLAQSPQDFNAAAYGYYDHSHFYKHLKKFLHKKTLEHIQPHLELLKALHQQDAE